MNQFFKSATVGACGGSFPTLVRLAMDLSNHVRRLTDIDGGFVVGTGLLAVVGAIVAWIWNEPDLKKAFYLGVGLPSFFTVIAANAGQPNQSKSQPALLVAYAAPSATGRFVKFQFPAQLSQLDYRAVFEPADPDEAAVPVVSDKDVEVPDTATSVRIESALAVSDKINLSDKTGSVTSIAFTAETRPLSGFLYALGFKTPTYQLKPSIQTGTASTSSTSIGVGSCNTPADKVSVQERNYTQILTSNSKLRIYLGKFHGVTFHLYVINTNHTDWLTSGYMESNAFHSRLNVLTRTDDSVANPDTYVMQTVSKGSWMHVKISPSKVVNLRVDDISLTPKIAVITVCSAAS